MDACQYSLKAIFVIVTIVAIGSFAFATAHVTSRPFVVFFYVGAVAALYDPVESLTTGAYPVKPNIWLLREEAPLRFWLTVTLRLLMGAPVFLLAFAVR